MFRDFLRIGAPPRAAALLLLLCGCSHFPIHRRPADLVLRGGVFRPGGGSSATAEALAESGGRIVYVGSNAGAAAWIGPSTRVVELKGAAVLPGFHDSHVHAVMGGLQLGECSLTELKTKEQVFEAIRLYAAKHPAAALIRGNGWDLPVFPEANPRKEDLDRLIPDRPAYFASADMHSAWVNSAALKLAGISKDTRDPPGGKIERDPATGEPSGTLRDPVAMDLVANRLPQYTPQEYHEGILRSLRLANSLGITSLHESWGTKEVVDALRAMDQSGELTARVTVAIFADPALGLSQVPALLETRRFTQGRRLTARTVKIFLDGVIEARTAAMLQPYDDRPGDAGKANWDPGVLNALVTELDRDDFQVHVHAIGDRAARLALDAFEHARRANGLRGNRHEIAHLEVIDPQDIPRFAQLGVVANFQPLWAYADDYINKLTLPGLGPVRSQWIYPIGTVLKTGARLACGSDWPVSSMNPLDAMQVAVTRRDPESVPEPAWLPQHLIGLSEALSCYTNWGAYVNFQDKTTGSLVPGKAADLVVLDRDIFAVPVSDLHRVKVLMTLLDGQVVYHSDPALF